MKKTAVVIAPGRGTYNAPEIGYLAQRHADKPDLIRAFDDYRISARQPTLSALDGAESFKMSVHTRGDNASALIYGCAYADYLSIDQAEFDILAITGNSMGWYIALACAGTLSAQNGMRVVNTMGTLMQDHLIGGQILYPYSDENWQEIPGAKQALLDKCTDISNRSGNILSLSIDLGGLLVLAGNEAGIEAFEAELPPIQSRFPMRLKNHAGFHSLLQKPVAALGRAALPESLFQQPKIPLIDGRGAVWYPKASDLSALWDYTLGQQVVAPYDFAATIRMAAREFCPDVFIVLGPGTTLGGSVAQSLIRCNWQGWTSKSDFQAAQKTRPDLVSMGG
ncbi:ACP S-malonyltransferase [Cognatishimia sp. WU-CL00825]|uniref:ACP S-malonyltransferase n=1 Tax=Cognatishimia sp. WU-CL00825 TaxID=3127658 RepID=UPI00310A04D0